MPDGGTTRRRLLGLVSTGVAVAVAGCETTPEDTTTTETAEPLVGGDAGSGDGDGGSDTATPTGDSGGNGGSGSGGSGGDSAATTDAPTESEPTGTPTVVPVPPPNALQVVERGLSVRQDDYYTYVDVRLELENTSDVTFTQLEFRVTVSYDPVDGEPREIGSGYVERRWPREERNRVDQGFAPGETYEFTERVRFETDGRAGRSSDDSRFSFDIAYRRVAYR
ncbi:hypothetical protein SAMN04487949_2458 [Halogranum gelatinilyticum]|uniref:Uncharacterized protein n=1 Tax=Halogranum gelatinilyticum TaxID=660521 RepID=A0A1G9VPQ7_9EURY|nr:hypothetical protein [Halogranum gelatinilyticum]SDM74130.1 hypothetical protein SAMN04487949_2458 [Halogranum gelatinilyticum]